jgi:6-phosphogluconolactonase
VADELVSGVLAAIAERNRADVIVTGGTVGIGTLAAVRHARRVQDIDWARVHIWWGDERFVTEGHADRNDQQARAALLNHIDIPDDNLHPFPSDHGQSVTQARDDFLSQYPDGFPAFDIALNGIGPDGHAASLFPGRDHGDSSYVIAVENSPKPPPERLSFTFRILNSARHVWIVASGSDKAEAIGRIAQDAPEEVTPAAALKGQMETVVWLDSDAAVAIRP